jgi:hypothetical protein
VGRGMMRTHVDHHGFGLGFDHWHSAVIPQGLQNVAFTIIGSFRPKRN